MAKANLGRIVQPRGPSNFDIGMNIDNFKKEIKSIGFKSVKTWY